MDLYGCFFKYAGEESEPYGLRLANVETQEFISLHGETESVSVFNRKHKQWHNVGTLYDKSQISFEIDIVSDTHINPVDVRAVQKWLFNQVGYKKLYIYNSIENQDDIYLNCRFINPEKIESASGLAGFRCTVECDSDMAWRDARKVDLILPGGIIDKNTPQVQNINISIDTDLVGYTYPTIELTMGQYGGDISIVNNTDSETRETSFINVPAGSTIIIKGSYNCIEGDFYNLFNHRNFPRLLDGDNNLTVKGDVIKLSVEWLERRFL